MTVVSTLVFMVWMVFVLLFVFVMATDPRSLKSGFFFVLLLGATAVFAIAELFIYADVLRQHPLVMKTLVILAVVVLIILAIFPVFLIAFLFVEGIRLIRREGFSLTNLLSIGLSVFLFLFLFVWPMINLNRNTFYAIDMLWLMVSLAMLYVLNIFAVFCFSAMLNLIHVRKPKSLKQIVVLGSGLINGKVSPLLAARINRGIDLMNSSPEAVLILSGGKGDDEPVAEGEAMKEYALEQGADPKRVIAEHESKNTRENLLFSSAFFPVYATKRNTAIVSTGYHVFRALILARSLGIDCKGYGSKTKWYFTINAIIREYIGYLSMTWKTHVKLLAILLFPFFVFFVIELIF